VTAWTTCNCGRAEFHAPCLGGWGPVPEWLQMLAGGLSGGFMVPDVPNAVGPVARRLFIETLEAQEAKGLAEYGRPLTAHNGRDPFADLLAEMVDAWQYAVQARMERDTLLTGLRAIEWDEETSPPQCAWCLGWKSIGHHDGCKFAALLAAALAGGSGT
jgi:hypothetical protein